MVVLVAVSGLQMRNVLVVLRGRVFCTMKTARSQGVDPMEEVTPLSLTR